MIYPGAFNLTTGPMHWELLQRARYMTHYITATSFSHMVCYRAVDNQIYVAMCSPARDLAAEYHAVSERTLLIHSRAHTLQWGHSSVVNPMWVLNKYIL